MQKITKKDKELLAELSSFLPSAEKELFEIFSYRLVLSIRKSSTEPLSSGYLKQTIQHSWNIFNQAPSFPVIDFYVLPRHDQKQKNTIVTLINKDKPFLLSSVLNILKAQGLSAAILIHPVFGLQRTPQGQLLYVHSRNILKKSLQNQCWYESFIGLHFNQELSLSQQENLRNQLIKAIQTVSLVVNSWELFKKQVHLLKDILEGEERDFLQWLLQDHFTFLNYTHYNSQGNLQNSFGISLPPPLPFTAYRLSLETELKLQASNTSYLQIKKTNQKSPIHKTDFLDLIEISLYTDQGKLKALHQFYGFFTRSSITIPLKEVPLLKTKEAQIFEKSDLHPQWHDGKVLTQLLFTFPRKALFCLPVETIFKFVMEILHYKKIPHIYLSQNGILPSLSCLIYLPVEDFSDTLKQQLFQNFHQCFLECQITLDTSLNENNFLWLHFTICFDQSLAVIEETLLKKLEKTLSTSLQSWHSKLQAHIKKEYTEEEADQILSQFSQGFDLSYQQRFTVSQALKDIENIRTLLQKGDSSLYFDWEYDKFTETFQLFLYHLETPIALSTILPTLENMGLKTLSEHSFLISLVPQKVSLQILNIAPYEQNCENSPSLKERLLETLQGIFQENLEDDGFNRLVINAGLTGQECLIFRGYAKYLRQVRLLYSLSYIEKTLCHHPEISQSLIELFYQRFDPQLPDHKVSKNFVATLKRKIAAVSSIDEEYILQLYLKLIMSTMRTSYFQKDLPPKPLTQGSEESAEQGTPSLQKNYIAFKIDSKKIDIIPLPRPHYEIYMYATDMEAVHLRGGNIARGGIRWSDRPEDFRTEILGLLKAQMTKNAIIVPTGSKGGFIIKPQKKPLTGQEAYKKMMGILLSLTDNTIKGKNFHPKQVRCHDGFDPYLVVAADKGTASFSDLANTISQHNHFWLGDAFASGGSQGYDHKKLSITAKGAWESVKRHFYTLNHTLEEKTFTVIGIGDMAGDVFGNGMLQSNKIKLIGAFNHLHIFVDPSPEPELSFKERQRLFSLNTSTWADYDLTKASKGAQIFERNQKLLTLSKEIRHLLGISTETISPNDLIRRLLTFPVDLLWFGGIGTFVKSIKESYSDISDKANDLVRVNAQDLRCKIIVEGANLGITQQGRVEYALKGGLIHTDFIDNSAGVNCSDHEVNLKILLDFLIENKKIPPQERESLLKEMTPEIVALVLTDNRDQALSLALSLATATDQLDSHLNLIKYFEEKGKINRFVENIPENLLLAQRIGFKGRKGFTAPELAVLTAYTKNILKEELFNCESFKENDFNAIFTAYFPACLYAKYGKFFPLHPLKKHITVNGLVNFIINRMGCTFVQDFSEQGIPLLDIFYSFILLHEVFPLNELWELLQNGSFEEEIQIFALLEIQKFIRNCCFSLLIDQNTYQIIKDSPELYKQTIVQLSSLISSFFKEEQKILIQKNYRRFVRKKIPDDLAERLSHLFSFSYCFDLLPIIASTQASATIAAEVYFILTDICGIYWLYTKALEIKTETKWQKQALSDLTQDIRLLQQQIVINLLQENPLTKTEDIEKIIEQWQNRKITDLQKVILLVDEVKNSGSFDLALLAVVVRQLKNLML